MNSTILVTYTNEADNLQAIIRMEGLYSVVLLDTQRQQIVRKWGGFQTHSGAAMRARQAVRFDAHTVVEHV